VRVLLTLHDAGGTVPPVVALCEALAARGHEATVLGQPSVRARVEAAGATFVAFSRLGDYDHRRTFEEQLDVTGAAIVGREVGDDLVRAAEATRADALVVDANLTGALAAAETLPQPSAVLLHSLYATYTDVWFADLWPFLGDAVNAPRRGFGLGAVDGWPGVFASHERLLAAVPACFDVAATAPPGTMRHVGFLVPRSAPVHEAISFPDGDGPTVLVGLGTTSQGQGPMLQSIVDQLGELDVCALVTTAGQAAPDAPPNVTVAEDDPHRAHQPQTDEFVTHGGLGSCAAGLLAGVPLVCTPIDRDQPLNASRVEALGAGLHVGVDAVGAAIERVLGDARFRLAAEAVAGESRAAGGPEAAVADLESGYR
jgi:UDP:flavonoid glycosyltransferase YjiC (YdhE family)